MPLSITLRTHPDGTEWPNEDGSPHRVIVETSPDTHGVIWAKHAKGVIRLQDGTSYDVTPDFISAPHEHHAEISHEIGLKFERDGHPLHKKESDPDFNPEVHTEFKHVCTDHCPSTGTGV